MPLFASAEEVPVEVACPCEGKPHDTDTVWLRADLSPDGGIAAMSVINDSPVDVPSLVGDLGRVYLMHNITRWTFTDPDGKPVPSSHRNIARLHWDIAGPIAEKADSLYSETLFRPLVARVSKSSRNGHTAPSTSRKPRSSGARQKP